jgi:predicted PurR-regulated permease PerM
MTSERRPFLPSPFVARAARWGLIAWSVIGVVILAGLFFRYVLYPIRIVFPPLVVALIVVYLLNPVITALERRGVRRVFGALGVYVVFLSVVGIALLQLVPVLTRQGTEFVQGVPDLLTRAQNGIDSFTARLGIHVSAADLVRAFRPGSGAASNFVDRVTSFTSGVVRVAFVLVLGPLIAFYLLVDLPKIQRGAQALIPVSRREELGGLSQRIGATLGTFFRGQLVVALLVGAFSVFGFWFVGLPYFALIGSLTALFALVPLIGTVIAAIPATFVALTATGRTGGVLHVSAGWKLALACVVVLVLAQQLDTRLLSRWLLKPAVRLHPVTVLLSLLLGATLLGLWGMVLAVPTVAAIKVIVLHVWDTRAQWPPSAPGSVEGPPRPPAADAEARSSAAREPGLREKEPARLEAVRERDERLGEPEAV